jgi:hypothetical protein
MPSITAAFNGSLLYIWYYQLISRLINVGHRLWCAH